MSGGSFDYLYHKEPAQLFDNIEHIENMVQALTNRGYTDAAKETEGVLLILRHFQARMEARLERLQPVWKAVEWNTSGDVTKATVDLAIKNYRKEIEL